MQIIKINLKCGDSEDCEKTLPCTLSISEEGVVITVDGYEELSTVFEYYDNKVQILVWDEESALSSDQDCKKIVISENIETTKFNIDRERFWQNLNQ